MSSIGIASEAMPQLTKIIERYLSDSMVLYAKTQGFHWNVQSLQFVMLHELFQKQYEDVAESIDDTAERLRMLGQPVVASLEKALQQAEIKEQTNALLSANEMIAELASDHEYMCKQLRVAIPEVQKFADEVTADYFLHRLSVHEKTVWFLRSHLVNE